MTCVVGIVQDGRIYFGCDSLGSNQALKSSYTNPKIFTKEIAEVVDSRVVKLPVIFGIAGSYRLQNLIMYNFEVPQIPDDMETEIYFAKVFIPEMIETLQEHNAIGVDNNVIHLDRGTLLIGLKNKLFTIQSDLSFVESSSPYATIGSGEAFALGSLYSQDTSIKAKKRIKTAIRAAKEFSPGVGGNINYATI